MNEWMNVFFMNNTENFPTFIRGMRKALKASVEELQIYFKYIILIVIYSGSVFPALAEDRAYSLIYSLIY